MTEVQKEALKSVSQQQVVKLLHNKFVVVMGDSIQRSVYKDLVLLLQTDKYLTVNQLRSKGEMSFEQDCLVEGGCLSSLSNGTGYREVRQYQSDHHLVRFYFVTRVYSSYMKSILNDFRRGPKPDVVIVNSCVWDISRYNCEWIDDYKENLHLFFDELNGVLPMETLVIWNITMPLAEKIRGGFLVAEIEHKMPRLRSDVIEANFFSGTLADGYGLDVLDLHFQFRFSLQHRAKDGVHWNAIAHRQISCLLLEHMSQAWGITLPCPLLSVENRDEPQTKKKAAGRCELSCDCGKTSHHKLTRDRVFTVIPRIEAPINFHYPPANYFSNFENGDKQQQQQQQKNQKKSKAAVIPRIEAPVERGALTYSREEFYSDSVSQGFMSFEEPRHWPESQQRSAREKTYTQPAETTTSTAAETTSTQVIYSDISLYSSRNDQYTASTAAETTSTQVIYSDISLYRSRNDQYTASTAAETTSTQVIYSVISLYSSRNDQYTASTAAETTSTQVIYSVISFYSSRNDQYTASTGAETTSTQVIYSVISFYSSRNDQYTASTAAETTSTQVIYSVISFYSSRNDQYTASTAAETTSTQVIYSVTSFYSSRNNQYTASTAAETTSTQVIYSVISFYSSRNDQYTGNLHREEQGDWSRADPVDERHQYVMKRSQRRHYAPYSCHRPRPSAHHHDYHYY
ncbi:hypothetical protein WMY93_014058 [Mugilogobius chulae]|uniref:Family with sequence similarity 113 n=1 Tax=Mugilogobius chulae TaxID=88201 RepID=A0AAW0NUI6_9GOBI